MRILFVSNFFPPAHLGGMEIRLQEVVRGLRQKGHMCRVLTSDFVLPGAELDDQPDVLRLLPLEANVHGYQPIEYLMRYSGRLREGLQTLRGVVEGFRPDLISIWGMWNFSPSFVAESKNCFAGPVVNSFAGYWPIEADMHQQYWRSMDGGWLGRQFKKGVGRYALSRRYRPVRWPEVTFDQAIFCSEYVYRRLREGGVTFGRAKVIFSGIDTDSFRPVEAGTRSKEQGLRVLFAGGLLPHKGAHTVVEALELLCDEGMDGIRLTIVGRGQSGYLGKLKESIREGGLENIVTFVAPVPRAEMPALMRDHDVVVLATITDEPLSRVVMEGMASGLVVIATDTGGTPEMITDGEDGLLFVAGDSAKLAQRLKMTAAQPVLRQKLAENARRKAVERFDLQRMIDDIELFLESVLATEKG